LIGDYQVIEPTPTKKVPSQASLSHKDHAQEFMGSVALESIQNSFFREDLISEQVRLLNAELVMNPTLIKRFRQKRSELCSCHEMEDSDRCRCTQIIYRGTSAASVRNIVARGLIKPRKIMNVKVEKLLMRCGDT
jgi:hypothetical protein